MPQEFPIGRIIFLYHRVASTLQMFTFNAGKGLGLPEQEYHRLVAEMDELCQICGDIGMRVTQLAALRVCEELRLAKPDNEGRQILDAPSASRNLNAFDQLVGCARHESTIISAIRIEGEAFSLYEQSTPLFGDDVASKFPSLAYDIEEAGKCLALMRSTAAAFHAIRCLEAGFAAIWRCLGVEDPLSGFERNWSNRLRRVQEAVEQNWPHKTGRMSTEAKFFDSIIGSLVAMQNPYRNTTMHFDQKYTQDEAKHIFDLVKGIMQKVASRMDESGAPKVDTQGISE